jgi:hypothetical protein
VSVCEHIVCFKAFGEKVLEVLLQGGNVWFLSFLNMSLCCSIVVLCS